MHEFIAKHREQIRGAVSGFDRLVFRGTLRAIRYAEGMKAYLIRKGVWVGDFSQHVQVVSERLKESSLAEARKLGRKIVYLGSSQIDKEALARRIAAEQRITEGPVCVLTCVEPCRSFEVYRNRETKKLDLVSRLRKCLFLYHYGIHPVFGFMNARIQTWFPFPVQVCLNGREWLAQQMQAASLKYLRQDNCFPWIEDFEQAQQLLDEQVKAPWRKSLDAIADQLHPLRAELFDDYPAAYYWSTYQSEWASDLVFRDPTALQRFYPLLLHHALTTFASPDVMRFLGHKIPSHGGVQGNFAGEVRSDLRRREEGVRVKHSVRGNSVKVYGKALRAEGSVLRVETTINCPEDFKVYRRKEGDRKGPKGWHAMRRGIADLSRRARVSQKCNERYLEALASVESSKRLEELTECLEQPRRWKGQRVRALHPFSTPDSTLLEVISRGEWTLQGFRNRDLQGLLFSPPAASPEEKRWRSAWVSRKLRLLRAHHLIQKVPHENRYRVTDFGRQAITAILTARQTTVSQLNQKAA
jgi:hypothetical protein